MRAYLRIVSGPDAGRTIELVPGGRLTIGRGEKSDTHLHDLDVCRLHCEVTWLGDEFHLTDLESVGGTFVGEQKIDEHVLCHGEEFQVGKTRFKLHTAGGAQHPEAPKSSGSVVCAGKPAAGAAHYPEAPKSSGSVVCAGKPAAGAVQHPQARSSASSLFSALKPEQGALSGKTISHYKLGSLLAKGCTGMLYKARDVRTGKDVAFKVLHPEFATNEEDVKRFSRAMTTAAELRHPNLVSLYGAGKQGDTCWFAMEYVEGEQLTKVIKRIHDAFNLPEWRFALTVGVQIAHALEAAHAKHVVHQNVAPESILIRAKDKAAKLGGVMLARVFERLKARDSDRTGAQLSNLGYVAPERTQGDVEADTRADIYGLGATLYALVTGTPPFQGKTPVETIAQIRQAEPVPLSEYQLTIPQQFQDAVMTMLDKRPERRFQTPAQAARALEVLAGAS
jgi:serine/threonine-protein kinase